MANEIEASCSLGYADSEGTDKFLEIVAKLASVATKKFVSAKQSVGTSEEAVQLGEVTAPRWAIFINRDATNYIELKTGTGGVIFAKLLPGEPAMLPLGSGAQAPYAIANTAACQLETLILST